MDGLLIVERMVLESLSNGAKSSDEINQCTNLSKALLGNILPMFLMRNIVSYKSGKYELNRVNAMQWMAKCNTPANIKEEVKELFTSLVNRYFQSEAREQGLRMKKVWMNSLEKKIFQSHLANLEEFIKSVEKENRRPESSKQLRDKEVIFWGHSPYSTLVDGVLEAV